MIILFMTQRKDFIVPKYHFDQTWHVWAVTKEESIPLYRVKFWKSWKLFINRTIGVWRANSVFLLQILNGYLKIIWCRLHANVLYILYWRLKAWVREAHQDLLDRQDNFFYKLFTTIVPTMESAWSPCNTWPIKTLYICMCEVTAWPPLFSCTK